MWWSMPRPAQTCARSWIVRSHARVVTPDGVQPVYGRVRAGQVAKLAALPQVVALKEMRSTVKPPEPPGGGAWGASIDRAGLRAKLAGAAASQPAAAARPADWFDVLDVHKSQAAWGLGYTGQGVKVLVNDTGIDFAHPDLQGTMARVTDPTSPYVGWPEMFDAYSMLNLAFDVVVGTDYIASGIGFDGNAPDYADTRVTRSGATLTDNGATLSAVFKPLGSVVAAGYAYTLPKTSKSGVFHFGSHPDTVLEKYYFDERPAVLVVDEQAAGVYDTVYVDLDNDKDFTDEKPARKGAETISQDLDGDGYADMSGGIVYWISDGLNPVPASDWMYGLTAAAAGAGDLVLLTIMDWNEYGGDHGQLCASAVAAQGVIDGDAPAWKPEGAGMVRGGGKDVKLSANGNFYLSVDLADGFLFAAQGYDGFPGTDDDMQIISNSWGNYRNYNDGWDYDSRSLDILLRLLNPNLSATHAAGNEGPGYGTVGSPDATLSIQVGASTSFDTTGDFDSIQTADQMQHGDSMSFSSRGPTAQGTNGISVLANGAFGAGDLPLTAADSGWTAWGVWGGTSKSAPTAAGNLALVYQAFRVANGRWPTNVEARAILMSSADKAQNDGFVEGAGVLNAERVVKIAGGKGGVFVTPDNWTFGDYRGESYPAFANILHPGQTATKQFTVYNPGAAEAVLTIRDEALRRIGSREWEFTSQNQALEEGDANRADYLFPISDLIPADTDLLEVRVTFPFGEYDRDGNYAFDSLWRVHVLDWTDLNGDGKLWQDLNGNGVVNCPGGLGQAGCEIQAGEYVRFGYGYAYGTALAERVKQPLVRQHDGVFLALRHRNRSAAIPVTHLKFQLNFYKLVDFPWLTTDGSVTVPAGGQATFTAKMSVPSLAGIGLYSAALRLTQAANETSLPVVANVAAWGGDFLFGGPPQSTAPYDNGEVFGGFDWTAGSDNSGDWRFYFADMPDDTPEGVNLLIDNRWTGGRSDLDTIVLGPGNDCASNGADCREPIAIWPGDPDIYGPYRLAPVGGSQLLPLSIYDGIWMYETSTGGPREIVSAPVQPGLHAIALHNVLYDGSEPEERFQGQVGTIAATPAEVDLFAGAATTGSFPLSIRATLPLATLAVDAFGLSTPEKHLGLAQHQDNPRDPSTSHYTFPVTIQNGGRLDIATTTETGDLDLFLLYDFNGDGAFDWHNEIAAVSGTSSPDEFISVIYPPDGKYLVGVHGFSAGSGTFDLTIEAYQGGDLRVTGLPAGPYGAFAPINFTVAWNKAVPPGAEVKGLVMADVPGALAVVQIPVRLHNIVTKSQTVTLTVQQDAALSMGEGNVNFGNWAVWYVGGADVLRSVVQFDTNGLNPVYPVQSAKLRIYLDSYGSTGGAHDLKVYGLKTAWSESTVTWKTPWTVAGGDYAEPAVTTLRFSKDDVGKWLELDVTALVSGWVTGTDANRGVLLRAINGASYAKYRFVSKEHWVTIQRPQLVVTQGLP